MYADAAKLFTIGFLLIALLYSPVDTLRNKSFKLTKARHRRRRLKALRTNIMLPTAQLPLTFRPISVIIPNLKLASTLRKGEYVKKLLYLSAIVLLLVLVMAAVATTTVNADYTDYVTNPGLQHASDSGAYHGAFQYYEGLKAGWIPEAARNGGIGDTTGPANSAWGKNH